MSSLKEIKLRINSVQSTQKITAAMKMISSAKLHRSQQEAEQALRYASELSEILDGLLADCDALDSPFAEQRPVRTVAIVACSSSSGLCGTYNANVWKELSVLVHHYEQEGVAIRFYPVGKKIADDLKRAGFPIEERFVSAAEKLSFEGAAALASELMERFSAKEVDKVELLYHHFKNTATQVLTTTTYLPLSVSGKDGGEQDFSGDYLFEPSFQQLQDMLFPKLLNLTIYTTLLDTVAAEHAARMMAMQVANDNANDLLQQLTLQYNKNRQQVITNELLDIMGGSMQ